MELPTLTDDGLMLADGRTVPNEEVVSTEVCVVGAGPAGITVARELGAAGFDVLLLERGEAQWSGSHPEPITAVDVGIPYDISYSRAWGLGGSTHKWRADSPVGEGLGRLRELDPSDFERREWVPHSGWPFSKEHLQPYYPRARSLFDCKWPSDQPEETLEWELDHGPFRDPRGRISMRIFFFANPAVFASQFKRELEYSQNVMVLTNSTAVEIRCDDSTTSASSMQVATATNGGFTVTARAYVLAMGGIENPRILLASQSRHPRGIGNGSDLVGRFFMEHPHYASGLMAPDNVALFEDLSSYAVHLHDGLVIQKKYSLAEGLVTREGLLGCAFLFESHPRTPVIARLRYGESAIESIRAAGRWRRSVRQHGLSLESALAIARIAYGVHHVARDLTSRAVTGIGRRVGLDRYTRHSVFRIQAMAEQVPNRQSRVELDDRKDRFGVPLARLNWQLTDQDIDNIRRSQRLFGQALAATGKHKVESLVEARPLPPALTGGNHHMGTTRMHDSPQQGVVDRDCRVHGMTNLFVAGSSVFPTGGYANPTLTVLALALRLSDHLKHALWQ